MIASFKLKLRNVSTIRQLITYSCTSRAELLNRRFPVFYVVLFSGAVDTFLFAFSGVICAEITLTRAGPLLGAERAGPGGVWLMGHVATRGKRHSKERQKS